MNSFEPIAAVARVMAGLPGAWFVSGGWAIDLFVGQVTREHGDREVGLFRRDQQALHAHLSHWALFKAVEGPNGGEWAVWGENEWLELPVHQILARPPGLAAPVTEEGRCPEEFEFFLNDAEGDQWICRRDPSITRLVGEIYRISPIGIPFLVPEIQLLFKAKYHREKDEHDFRTAVSRMTAPQREWLKQALERVHPGDPWLACL